MSSAPTPDGQSSFKALLRASDLLSEWEQARPCDAAPIMPMLRTAFNQFMAEVLSDTHETNLDIVDARDVLRGAAGLAIGCANASGPRRVQQALQEAYQNMQAVGPLTAPQGRILLLVQSRPDAELEMDELIDITDTMRRNVGLEWEMVFGYGIVLNLPAEIRLTFMLAPSSPQ